MTVEQDEQAGLYVRGTCDDGQPGWGIQVWLKGSPLDGPEAYRYRVVDGNFHRQRAYNSFSAGSTTFIDDGLEPNVDAAVKEAVLALIAKWEEKLPLMVPGPLTL